MNKSVLRTAIAIIISLLLIEYTLKFFIPKEFVLVASNKNFIKFGTFLNEHRLFYHMFFCITAFITYYLYTCACSRRKYLNWKYYVSFVVIYFITQIIGKYANNLLVPALVCIMIALAYFSESNMKDFAIVFIVHTISQNLSLEIRGLTRYLISYNSITIFALGIESYLWLILFYVLNCFNIKEREVK